MRVTLNTLETQRFGAVCARAVEVSAAECPALDQFCAEHQVAMLTTRIATSDTACAQALEAAGHRLMDTLVYFERSLPAHWPAPPHVRPAEAADADAVAHIARAAFTNYMGHYFADPRLDSRAATEAMVEWALGGLGSAAPYWLWADDAGVAGFLMGALLPDGSADIVLNAVHPQRQRGGVYAALVQQACVRFAALGCPRVEVSTQIQNTAVQKVWARHGFTPFKSLYTFHKWYV
jgi:ribosomal protein S18 acetylase RimI-like enzyme